ncbi:MAG: polysaccharide deacetylase family protein [Bacteroidota bacterium]|nr:polysaccharide deacetylase family protein [Odoribacter sp.]MDP3643227.1 polysaccharide deacetylase family protein [Bacteroidota bacterium]
MKCFDPRVRLPGFFTSLLKEAVWRFDATGRIVYLTFDDGPIPEVTPWVLGILRAEEIKATFFCVGENVMKYPEVYKQILIDGHSVGNHTFNHLEGLKKGNQEYFGNIERAAEFIDSDLFRPPHGWLKPSQFQFLKKKFRIIMWDLISCDYNSRIKPERVFKNITDFVRPGSIVTFHDSIKAQGNLKQTLQLSIRWMKEQGYRFEAIPYDKRK